MPKGIYQRTAEQRRKLAEINRSAEHRRKISAANRRRRLTLETRVKIAASKRGKRIDGSRSALARTGRKASIGHRVAIGAGVRAFWASERSVSLRAKMTEIGVFGRFRRIRGTTAHEEAQAKASRARLARPNKLEAAVAAVLEAYFPGQWRYNAGLIRIGRRIPDFVCESDGAVLEVFGVYWHRGQGPSGLVEYYASLGYTCFVVWEDDFRRDPFAMVRVVREGHLATVRQARL